MRTPSIHNEAVPIDLPKNITSATEPAREFDGVIFDFDGTLVDTMALHYEAYRQTFAELGFDLSYETFFSSIGGNARETIPKLLCGRPCSATTAAIHARKKELVRDSFANEPISVLESSKLLPLLSQFVPLALASSGSREGIDILLDRLEWRCYFKTIVSGEDAVRGKPAPDLFLIAAERIGVPSERCLVFEDTDAGLEAATRSPLTLPQSDIRKLLLKSHIASAVSV